MLSEHFNGLRLELAGGDHADKTLQENLIETLSLQNNVKYVGILTRTEIPTFLAGAKILVLARPQSKQAEGGFPTKLGEYLASGVPVCCTKVGEIPLYLNDKESVFFVEPGSPVSFMETMKYIIENPIEASEVGADGRLIAENTFGSEKRVGELLGNFEKAIHNN